MFHSQAPPAYLPAGPPPQTVTYFANAQPNTAYHTAQQPQAQANGPYYTVSPQAALHTFSISPTAGGAPTSTPGSSGTMLVAPAALLASSGGAGAPAPLSTSGSFAAPSSGHGSIPHHLMTTPPSTNAHGTTTFRNLKVGGLPPSVTDADLFDMFQRFGKIESAKVMLNVHTCESRGYGFVLFDTQEAGCRAFGDMNGKTLTLRGIEMTLDVKNSDWDGRQAVVEINSIYVRNIPNSVTDDELKKYFAQFGTVVTLSTRTAVAQAGVSGHTPGGTSLTGATLSNGSLFTQPGAPAESSEGSTTASATDGAATIEQQLHSMLDDDDCAGRAAARSDTTDPRVSPAPKGAASLNADPPSFASCDYTGEQLGKLAMVEFTTIESARQAIAATHRVTVFPNASTPVLSKFADAPHVKEQRRNQRKLVQASHPPTSLPTQPQHPQYVAVVGSSFPPMSASNNQLPPMPPQRFPEAVPLPVSLPRPGTTHRLYYQGLLGLTAEGTLYPIRPDVCVHVVGTPDNRQMVPQQVMPYQTPVGYQTAAIPHHAMDHKMATAVVET